MESIKREAEALVSSLPDDCTFGDIHYHLYVLEQIKRGIESADTEPTLAHAEVEARMQRWLIP